MEYEFPAPENLPKMTVDKYKVKIKLQQIAAEIIEVSRRGNNTVIVNLHEDLNVLEREEVVAVITAKGYTVRSMGSYQISWS